MSEARKARKAKKAAKKTLGQRMDCFKAKFKAKDSLLPPDLYVEGSMEIDPDTELTPAQEVDAAITRASQPLLRFMAQRDRRFRRIMHTIMGMTVLILLSTIIIISAVAPHVPFLRIFERNQKQLGQSIATLNHYNECVVTWANGQYIYGCDDVYTLMNSREIPS